MEFTALLIASFSLDQTWAKYVVHFDPARDILKEK